jgi:type II secretion system protein J
MPARLHQPLRFTLLELLIAAMAGAVLLAALLAALGGAWRLQEQSHEQERAEAPRQALRQRLAGDLALAVPPAELLAGSFTAVAEEVGDRRHDDLEWVTAIGARDPDSPGGDLVRVHYYLSANEAGDAFQLVRTEDRDLLAAEVEEPREVVLLRDVTSFAAEWYDGETWTASWDSTVQENRLPEAARIRIELDAGTGEVPVRPLELVVPLVMRTLSAEGGSP